MGERQSDSGAGDLKWQDYEELVKDIYQVLGRADGVTIECWGPTCKVEGPPGVFHQIDVLTRHTAGLHEYRTAIECKNWNRKVGPSVVREIAQIVQDTGLDKGVVVSKMGFSDQAKTLARSHNIGLVELRRPVDRDWEGYIRVVPVIVTMVPSPIYRVRLNIIIAKENSDREASGDMLEASAVALDRFFVSVSGQITESLEELIDAEVNQRPDQETHDLQFKEGSVLTIPDNPEHLLHGHSIRGVSVKVEQGPPISEEITIRADDHVYMVMESIFDGKRFTITNDGSIVENDR